MLICVLVASAFRAVAASSATSDRQFDPLVFYSVPETSKKIRKPKAWKHSEAITRAQLVQMREEFWDTAPHYGGRKEICLGGRFIFGPDGRSVFLSILLIVAPAAVFCVFVVRKLMDDFSGDWGISVVVVCVVFTVYMTSYIK